MSLELVEVTSNEITILENMLHFYLNDLSKYTKQLSTNKEGIFEYDSLDNFFTKPNLVPFFIINDDQIIGFMLFDKTTKRNRIDYCIEDLFILKQYRGLGFSKRAVHHLVCTFPGTYYILQLEKNQLATLFWKSYFQHYHVEYTEKLTVDSGETCIARTFRIPAKNNSK